MPVVEREERGPPRGAWTYNVVRFAYASKIPAARLERALELKDLGALKEKVVSMVLA